MDIDELRDSLARITQRGIGMPIAGGLLWLGYAVAGATLAPRAAAFVAFCATGLVFPLGWWLTRRLGGDLMHKGHPLTGLGMALNFVQFAYWPVLIAVCSRDPALVPFTMATLFVSHFLPYGWFYRSRGYLLLGGAGPALATTLQLAAPGASAVAIPLAMAALHAIAVLRLADENRRLGAPAAVAAA